MPDRRENELAWLRGLVDELPVSFSVTSAIRDSAGRIEDFRIEYINPAAAEFLGLTVDEPVGKRVLEVLPALRGTEIFERLKHVTDTGEPFREEMVAFEDEVAGHRIAGSFDVRAVKFGDGYLQTSRDITEAKRAEAELARSEARLAAAQRVAHLGSWEWDIPADTVTWSDELHRIFGTTPETFEGSYEAYLNLVHPDDHERVEARIQEALRTGNFQTFDHRIRRPDGSERFLTSTGDVIPGPDGRPVRMVGTALDITGRKLAEEEVADLRMRQAELERRTLSQRHAVEINDDILQGLILAAYSLRDGDRERTAEALEGTIAAARRLIGEFLDEAGVQAGDLRRERPAGAQTDEPAEVDS